jgi:hypothetical protein
MPRQPLLLLINVSLYILPFLLILLFLLL